MNLDVGATLGDYVLTRALGRGAMGAVFVGRHRQSGAEHAIKVLRLGGSRAAERRERFAREARALARVDTHPAIVRVHHYGTQGDLAYCALELVEGQDLEALLEGGQPPAQERTLRIVAAVADALAHVHGAGIVHRDVKPANVLVRARDDQPLLTDFGIARDEGEERMTAEDTLVGTPNYMSPEQVTGQVGRIGPASDVFSLGAVLYELLSGEQPFAGDSLAQLMHAILSSDPPAVDGVRGDLDRIVRSMLRKEPEERPTAEWVAAALRAFAAGDGIAWADTQSGAGWLRVGRRRQRVVGLALAGVMLVVAAAVVARGVTDRLQATRAWEEEAHALLRAAAATVASETAAATRARLGLEAPASQAALDAAREQVDALSARPAARASPLGLALDGTAQRLAALSAERAALLELSEGRSLPTAPAVSEPARDLLRGAALARAPKPGTARELATLAETHRRERPAVGAELRLQAARAALALGQTDAARGELARLPRELGRVPRETAGPLARGFAALSGEVHCQRALVAAQSGLVQDAIAALDEAEASAGGLGAAGAIRLAEALLGEPSSAAALSALVEHYGLGLRWPAELAPALMGAAEAATDLADRVRYMNVAVRLDPVSEAPSTLTTDVSQAALRSLSGDPDVGLAYMLLALRGGMPEPVSKGVLIGARVDVLLTEYLAAEPDDWAAHYMLARASDVGLGSPVRSLEHQTRAIELSGGRMPPRVAARALVRQARLMSTAAPDRFWPRLRELEAQGVDGLWEVYRDASTLCLAQGRPDEAVTWARRHQVEMMAAIGRVRAGSGRLPVDTSRVEDLVTKGLEVLVPALLAGGDGSAALRALDGPEGEDAEPKVSLVLRARALLALGRHAEAAEAAEQALEIDPKSERAAELLRRARKGLAR